MKTINEILLLTDFSEVSNYATQYALNISKKIKSDVEIMHIVNTPVDWVKLPLEKESLYPEIKAEIGHAKSKLSDLISKFSKEGIEAKRSLVFNMGAEDISQYISEEKYDLIILGSHGSKGIKKFTIGSNAQKVIRNSLVPTLIVKTAPKTEALGRIVMASTFEQNQKPYFKKLFNYASDLGAGIDLLYINTPYAFKETSEIEKMLTSFLDDCPENNCEKHHVDALNEERGIQFFMEKSNARLFTMATKGKSALSQLFSKSLTESVVSHLDIPVLVFHI